MMAAKGIWRAGTETPHTEYRGTPEAFERTVAGLQNAYKNGVNLTFSTDADYYVPGMTRGEIVMWTRIEDYMTVASDLHIEVNDELKRAGIRIPIPQRDLHLRAADSEKLEDVVTEPTKS